MTTTTPIRFKNGERKSFIKAMFIIPLLLKRDDYDDNSTQRITLVRLIVVLITPLLFVVYFYSLLSYSRVLGLNICEERTTQQRCKGQTSGLKIRERATRVQNYHTYTLLQKYDYSMGEGNGTLFFRLPKVFSSSGRARSRAISNLRLSLRAASRR